MEMWDWMRMHPWSAWLSLSLLLGALEMLTLDFTLLMLAGGALAGALTALVLPGVLWAQVVVALVTAVLLLFALRPTMLARIRNAPSYRGSFETLVGSEATALSEVTSDGGLVKVGGLEWQAQLIVPGRVSPGQKVEVYEVDGTTLKVYPSGALGGTTRPGLPG